MLRHEIAAAEAELHLNRMRLSVTGMFLDIMEDSHPLRDIGIAKARKARETDWQGGRLPRMREAAEIGENIRHTILRNAIDNGNAGGPAMDAALSGLFDLIDWTEIGDHFQKYLEE